MHWNGSRQDYYTPDSANIQRSLGRIEGQLSSNSDRILSMENHFTHRLDRIETRLNKIPQPRPPWNTKDVLPWLWGAIVLGLVLAGKLDLPQALGLMRGGGG